MKIVASLTVILFWSAVYAASTDAQSILSRNAPGSIQQDSRALTGSELSLRVQELITQNDLNAAYELAARSLRQNSDDAGMLNLLGVIEARRGNYPAAEAAFQKSLLRSPKMINVQLNLGRLYQENQKSDAEAARKALEVYRRILQQQPDNVESLYQSAVLLLAQARYRQSLAHLSRLPAGPAASAQVLAIRLANQIGLNDPNAAATARQLIAHPDFSEPDMLTVLPTLEANKRDESGVELIEELHRRGKASSNSLYQLALLYERGGRLADARAALEKSAAGNRQLTTILVDLARVARKQKDTKSALGYLAHARDLEPDNAKVHYLFGLVCLDSDLLAESFQAFKRALDLAPAEPLYNYALGIVAAHLNDSAKALPYLQNYRRLKPADARGQLALGVAYFNHKDFGAARQTLRAAAASSSAEVSSAAHFYLGSIARQEGRCAEALAEMTNVLRLNPRSADALAESGHCSLQDKDYASARSFFERAVAVDPTHYLANYGLLLLYSRLKDPREKAQATRFDSIKERRYEKARTLLTTIEAQPPSND